MLASADEHDDLIEKIALLPVVREMNAYNRKEYLISLQALTISELERELENMTRRT